MGVLTTDQIYNAIILDTRNIHQAAGTRLGLRLHHEMIAVSPTEHFFNPPKDPLTAAFVSGELVH